ncbi:hypothetical protein TNCV_1563071 [Trichonephila clavipes]|nr:hypothetical protein TNCV_1563071 [Trichonephila clavipes]
MRQADGANTRNYFVVLALSGCRLVFWISKSMKTIQQELHAMNIYGRVGIPKTFSYGMESYGHTTVVSIPPKLNTTARVISYHV